jgi:hypothetical protein
MKGHKWSEYSHKVTYPVLAEVKIDEIRVHAKLCIDGVNFMSYAGKPLHNLQRFALAVERVLNAYNIYELDLGFECNGNFNDSYRYVRSSRGVPEDLQAAPYVFTLYDVPDPKYQWFSYPYISRRLPLSEIVLALQHQGINCVQLPYYTCHNESEVLQEFERQIALGNEGLMVKTMQHTYQRGKRSKDWLKVKPEEEADGEIIELIEAHAVAESNTHCIGDPLGRTGSIVVRLEDGSIAAPAGLSHDLGFEMHQNPEKFLGQWIMFKYMQRDRAGGYRHPSFVRFREAKA